MHVQFLTIIRYAATNVPIQRENTRVSPLARKINSAQFQGAHLSHSFSLLLSPVTSHFSKLRNVQNLTLLQLWHLINVQYLKFLSTIRPKTSSKTFLKLWKAQTSIGKRALEQRKIGLNFQTLANCQHFLSWRDTEVGRISRIISAAMELKGQ